MDGAAGGRDGYSEPGQRALAALSLTVLLLQACASGDVVTVSDLISVKNANPFGKDELGRTPLVVACTAGHVEVVRYLIEKEGVSPGFRGEGGTTPLHVAVRGGHLEMVRYLIDKKGVDPSCEDGDGATPLDCALHIEVSRFLLSRGARKSKTDQSNQNSLTCGFEQEQSVQVHLLSLLCTKDGKVCQHFCTLFTRYTWSTITVWDSL